MKIKNIEVNGEVYELPQEIPSLEYEFASFNYLTETEKDEIVAKLVEIRDSVTYVTIIFRGNKHYGTVSGSYPYGPIEFKGTDFNKMLLQLQIYQGVCTETYSNLTTTDEVQELINQAIGDIENGTY